MFALTIGAWFKLGERNNVCYDYCIYLKNRLTKFRRRQNEHPLRIRGKRREPKCFHFRQKENHNCNDSRSQTCLDKIILLQLEMENSIPGQTILMEFRMFSSGTKIYEHTS